MRILQLISSSEGYFGAERVCVTLASALEKIGVTSPVCAFRNTHKSVHLEVLEHAASHGLKTEEIVSKGRLDLSAVRALRALVKKHEIDIVHCHNIKPNLYGALARESDVGLLSTCHTWHTGTTEGWVVSMLDRCILHAFDRLVLVSDHMKPEIRRFGLSGEVIYNGIDLEQFPYKETNSKRDPGWVGRPIVGAIGRLSPEKGMKYFVSTAAKVLRVFPNALFLLVGDGCDRQTLEAQAKDLGISGSVLFLGVRQDVPELLSSLDVLVMPSIIEGMPMALLEAMASGRAVVASSVGSIPSVLRHRVNGILVKAGEVESLSTEVTALLMDNELRAQLGDMARKTVESNFSAASMTRKYLRVYQEMIVAQGTMRSGYPFRSAS